ncbi:hypothetical protein [Streptomyces sp. LN704]
MDDDIRDVFALTARAVPGDRGKSVAHGADDAYPSRRTSISG